MKKLANSGFAHHIAIVGFVVVFAIAGVAYLVASHADSCSSSVSGSVSSTVSSATSSSSCQPVSSAVSTPSVSMLFQAESMTPAGAPQPSVITNSAANGGKFVAYYSNGSLSKQFSGSPLRSMTISARGSQCYGAPIAQITLDGAVFARIPVSTTNWQPYTVQLNNTNSTHQVKIDYVNNYNYTDRYSYKKRCDRNLYLDTVYFSS